MKFLTGMIELHSTPAPLWQPHNSYHLGPQAGSPLLSGGETCWIGVATIALLDIVHFSTDAGAADHIPGGGVACLPIQHGHLEGPHWLRTSWVKLQKKTRRYEAGGVGPSVNNRGRHTALGWKIMWSILSLYFALTRNPINVGPTNSLELYLDNHTPKGKNGDWMKIVQNC